MYPFYGHSDAFRADERHAEDAQATFGGFEWTLYPPNPESIPTSSSDRGTTRTPASTLDPTTPPAEHAGVGLSPSELDTLTKFMKQLRPEDIDALLPSTSPAISAPRPDASSSGREYQYSPGLWSIPNIRKSSLTRNHPEVPGAGTGLPIRQSNVPRPQSMVWQGMTQPWGVVGNSVPGVAAPLSQGSHWPAPLHQAWYDHPQWFHPGPPPPPRIHVNTTHPSGPVREQGAPTSMAAIPIQVPPQREGKRKRARNDSEEPHAVQKRARTQGRAVPPTSTTDEKKPVRKSDVPASERPTLQEMLEIGLVSHLPGARKITPLKTPSDRNWALYVDPKTVDYDRLQFERNSEGQYKCSACDATNSDPRELKLKHFSPVHLEGRPFACPVPSCNWASRDRTGRDRHVYSNHFEVPDKDRYAHKDDKTAGQ
ncbi:hypothetical protein C8Q76DRAFT_794849 [Earliella scabrosa]|nr:hypothetical protein C8Q76DRAFT_794849 [Earliella scabrosa]